jgi:hypothetical protein
MRLSDNRSPRTAALPRCSTTRGTGFSLSRRAWLAALAAFAGCRRSAPPIERLFPAALAGSRLAQVRRLPLADLSAELRRFKVRQAATAAYEGKQPLRVELYEMANPKTAYTLARLSKEAAPFFHGDYFGIIQAPGAGRAALESYLQEFERHLGAK